MKKPNTIVLSVIFLLFTCIVNASSNDSIHRPQDFPKASAYDLWQTIIMDDDYELILYEGNLIIFSYGEVVRKLSVPELEYSGYNPDVGFLISSMEGVYTVNVTKNEGDYFISFDLVIPGHHVVDPAYHLKDDGILVCDSSGEMKIYKDGNLESVTDKFVD